VKVVEGSEIYNFPIYHLEHFYTIFFEFDAFKAGYCNTVMGWPTLRRAAPRRRVRRARACAATPRANTAPALAPRRLGVRVARRPRPRLSQDAHAARRLELRDPPRVAP
jgi:hypothetical protein